MREAVADRAKPFDNERFAVVVMVGFKVGAERVNDFETAGF